MTTTQMLLDAQSEPRLARRIEAGLVAAAVRAGELSPLSDATPQELDRLVREGREAFDLFVRCNVRLVWFVVNPMADRSGLDRDELFQEGVCGLIEAVQRYDHRLGPFARFALPRIRMRVWDASATALGRLGLSAGRAKVWRQVRSVTASLTVAWGRTPSVAEVARALGRTETLVRDLMGHWPASRLDAAVADALPAVEEERVRPDEVGVARLVRALVGVDRAIVTRRYGLAGEEPQTCRQVAAALGLSESTVRRRERAALDRLQPAAAAVARTA